MLILITANRTQRRVRKTGPGSLTSRGLGVGGVHRPPREHSEPRGHLKSGCSSNFFFLLWPSHQFRKDVNWKHHKRGVKRRRSSSLRLFKKKKRGGAFKGKMACLNERARLCRTAKKQRTRKKRWCLLAKTVQTAAIIANEKHTQVYFLFVCFADNRTCVQRRCSIKWRRE